MSRTYQGGAYQGEVYSGDSGFDYYPVSARVKYTAPIPLAQFPLVGAALSMAVNIFDPQIFYDALSVGTRTQTWNGGPGDNFVHNQGSEQNLFPPQNRVFSVTIFSPDLFYQALNPISYTRQWNGIGGFIYIPSFPQLSRRETTWPHAT